MAQTREAGQEIETARAVRRYPRWLLDRRLHYALLAAGFALGLGLRLWLLDMPPDPNFRIWRAWAVTVVNRGIVSVYLNPPNKGLYLVNYPPISLYVFGAIGRVFAFVHPPGLYDPHIGGFEATVRAIGVLTDVLLTVALVWFARLRGYLWRVGLLGGLVYWLNPTTLGDPLGFTDNWFAAFAVIACILFARKRYEWGVLFYVVAILLKPQPLFLAPALAVWLWRSCDMGRRIRLAALGAAAYAVVTIPYILSGTFVTVIAGTLVNYPDDIFISERQGNIWWLWTWVREAAESKDGLPKGLLTTVTHFVNQPFLVGTTKIGPLPLSTWAFGLLALFLLAMMARVATWPRAFATAPETLFYTCALGVFAYAQIAAQVHENHLFVVVPLLAPLVLSCGWRVRLLFGLLSFTVAVNLLMFLRYNGLPVNRGAFGFDISLPIALVTVALFVLACVWFWRGTFANPPRNTQGERQ